MDRIAVIRMLFHLLLASIIALAFPSPPYLYREKEETGLSSRLIKSRIFLCNRSQKQRKGCSAAFRYLEELTIEHKNSLGAFSFENPGPFLTRLEARLASSGVQESEWVEGALNAWLGALEPHAKLVNAKEADRAATAEKMLVQGAGAKLRFYRGKVLVGYLLDGSSAESTGLQIGRAHV